MKRNVAKKAVAPKTKLPVEVVPRSKLKEVSVMAWIEDPYGKVLLVKQVRGRKLWSFPGGKVGAHESLQDALWREVKEETGLIIDVAAPIDIYDRPAKGTLAVLFRVILKENVVVRLRKGEIEKYAFRRTAPQASTPSLSFFWKRAQRTFDPLSML